MPKFTPQTTIYLCDQTGIDDSNKPYYKSDSEMVGWLMGKVKATFSDYSYQRADERQFCTVEYDYYDALTCDVIMWRNAGHSAKWIIANITELEWVNPNTTRIYFKVDAWCTFCGTAQLQPCFVEREHVENDWQGSLPNFANIGVSEGFDCTPERIVSQRWDDERVNDVILIVYADKPSMQVSGGWQHDVYTGLNYRTFASPGEANAFLTSLAEDEWSNLQDVVGVYTLPQYMIDGTLTSTEAPPPPWETAACAGKYNNAKVYCSELCVFQIESPCGNDYTYKPELIPYPMLLYRVGRMAAGVGGAACYVANYAYVENRPQTGQGLCAMITEVPQGQVVGNSFSNMMAAQLSSAAIRATGNVLMTALGGAAGGPGLGMAQQGVGGLISTGVDLASFTMHAKKASAGVNGGVSQNANLAMGLTNYRFMKRWYTPTEAVMTSIDNYFDRFGYRVDRLKTPSITRPRWNYLKCREAHIKGSMPYEYRVQIEQMLEKGVTFWNTGAVEIGDFSNPQLNKG